MTSLGELVAGIAHKVNNPLAFSMAHLGTIAGALSKLDAEMEGALTEKATAYLDKAQQRALDARMGLERVTDIVSRLRTFSRLDEGEFKDADIKECIESALAFMAHKIRDRLVDIDIAFAQENQLFCAPGILNQAFLNLLSNARTRSAIRARSAFAPDATTTPIGLRSLTAAPACPTLSASGYLSLFHDQGSGLGYRPGAADHYRIIATATKERSHFQRVTSAAPSGLSLGGEGSRILSYACREGSREPGVAAGFVPSPLLAICADYFAMQVSTFLGVQTSRPV